MDFNEKLNAVLANPDFYEEGKSVETVADFVDLLKKYDVELTTEEADAVLAQLGMLIAQEQGELTEDDLEDVSGGAALGIAAISLALKGGVLFCPVGGIVVGVAALAGACYYAKKKSKR